MPCRRWLSPVIFRAMAKTRLRHGSYLFQRGSIWWIRLRSPAGRTERSLRTADKKEAELAALPLIAAHKAALLAAKPRVESVWTREFEPGLHVGLNGEKIYATHDQLHFLDEVPVRIEPNGVMAHRLVARGPLSAHTEFSMLDAAHGEAPPHGRKRRPRTAMMMRFWTPTSITAISPVASAPKPKRLGRPTSS